MLPRLVYRKKQFSHKPRLGVLYHGKYAWYQPDKRDPMNVNDRSLWISSTSLPECWSSGPEKKGKPKRKFASLEHDHPKVGHGYRYENNNAPYGAFLNKRGQ